MNVQCNAPISDRFSSLCARVFYRRSAILKNRRGEGPGDEVGAFGCLVSSIRTSRLASGFSVKSTRSPSWIRTVISRRLCFVHIPMSSASRELISPMSLHKVLIYFTELKNYWNNWSITITIATKEIYSKIMKTFVTFGC